jgi:hypothetical protein
VIRWPILGVIAMTAAAQQVAVPPSVRVHGEGSISRTPDRVQVDAGVITSAATSQAAAELNARQSKALLDGLRQALPAANIHSVNISVIPRFQYPKSGPPAIEGYTANNTVRIELDDLSLLPKLIDAATRAGASTVNRLSFGLRDENGARAEALAKAADQAHAAAAALADRLHVKLGRVLQVEEEEPVVVSPGRQVELTASQSGPIQPGSIDVHANVSVTYEIVQ